MIIFPEASGGILKCLVFNLPYDYRNEERETRGFWLLNLKILLIYQLSDKSLQV